MQTYSVALPFSATSSVSGCNSNSRTYTSREGGGGGRGKGKGRAHGGGGRQSTSPMGRHFYCSPSCSPNRPPRPPAHQPTLHVYSQLHFLPLHALLFVTRKQRSGARNLFKGKFSAVVTQLKISCILYKMPTANALPTIHWPLRIPRSPKKPKTYTALSSYGVWVHIVATLVT